MVHAAPGIAAEAVEIISPVVGSTPDAHDSGAATLIHAIPPSVLEAAKKLSSMGIDSQADEPAPAPVDAFEETMGVGHASLEVSIGGIGPRTPSPGVGANLDCDEEDRSRNPGDFTPPGFDLGSDFDTQPMQANDSCAVLGLPSLPAVAGDHAADVSARSSENETPIIDAVLIAYAPPLGLGTVDDVTPAMAVTENIGVSCSSTPKSWLRKARVIQPSKALLPPFRAILASKSEDGLYREVIKHCSRSRLSKIKTIRVISFDTMWVSLGELADSVMPRGELSNTVAEIGIHCVQVLCSAKKIVLPWILSVYLLSGNFNNSVVRKHFRRDDEYKLSHYDLLLFPVLQKLGTEKSDPSHWYVLSLNMRAKRFEVLDSVRGQGDKGMIEHATRLMDAIKSAFLMSYSASNKDIQDYELLYIDVIKQDSIFDCGYFMLIFLELWDGRNVPAITPDQIPAVRKVLTSRWLMIPHNIIKRWRDLLDSDKI